MTEGVPASYEEQVGMLLAEIADLILSGKQDWATLERLREALYPMPPFAQGTTGIEIADSKVIGLDPEPPLKTTISKQYIREAMEKIYESKIREQLKVPQTLGTPKEYITWTDSSITETTNPTTWSYSIKRRDGKNGPSKI